MDYKKRLVIIEGNAKTLEDVKQLFSVEVSQVIFGIGATPSFSLNPFNPFTLDDPDVCRLAMTTLLAALEATSSNPPIAAISTTGISDVRDVPYALVPLYKWLLHTPHQDKAKMEHLLVESGRSWTLVRPTLLVDGDGAGKKVRAGWEGEGSAPAMGYTISRVAVGQWIFAELVKGGPGEWVGRKVTLTW